MDIAFDPVKRADTIRKRALDFLDAPKVFEGRHVKSIDARFDYGEARFVTYGWIDMIAVAVVWMERDGVRRIISMRKMHRWEIEHVGLD